MVRKGCVQRGFVGLIRKSAPWRKDVSSGFFYKQRETEEEGLIAEGRGNRGSSLCVHTAARSHKSSCNSKWIASNI